LLLGVADCCRIIHFFAFTASSVLLISITFCFDLPALHPSNGKLFVSCRNGQCDGVDLRWIGKMRKREVISSIVTIAPA
jgi:hypothetical protein